MHPAFLYWWKNRHHGGEGGDEAGCGPGGGCGPSQSRGHGWHGYRASHGHGEDFGDAGGGAFGVRRPLRFLAYKLELDEKQVGELAAILSELKTERAQGDVDGRRSIAGLADAVAGDAFDDKKAGEAAALRVQSADKLREAVLKALRRIHALLGPDQRAKLAYLIRTGVVTL